MAALPEEPLADSSHLLEAGAGLAEVHCLPRATEAPGAVLRLLPRGVLVVRGQGGRRPFGTRLRPGHRRRRGAGLRRGLVVPVLQEGSARNRQVGDESRARRWRESSQPWATSGAVRTPLVWPPHLCSRLRPGSRADRRGQAANSRPSAAPVTSTSCRRRAWPLSPDRHSHSGWRLRQRRSSPGPWHS